MRQSRTRDGRANCTVLRKNPHVHRVSFKPGTLESQVAAYEAIYRDLLGLPPACQALPA